MNSPSQAPALLLGGGIVALSVGRRLARLGIPVVGLGHQSDPLRYSRHRSEFVDTGSGDGQQQRWREWLENGPRRGVVLPCSDEALELVARNRPRLTELGYATVEADDEVLLAMLDKGKTAELAEIAGIDVPRTAIVSRDRPLPSDIDEFAFPCALKPRESHVFARHYGMRKKLFVVETRAELERRLAELPEDLHMIATEIVPGPDRFCSYYSYIDEHGDPLFHYTKQKLRQYPTRFGLGTYHLSDWNPEVAEVGLRFLQGVGLRGLACVEFKRDPRDGQLKLIECNHRFTAANSLLQACGIDLAQLAYERALGRPGPEIDGYRRGLYLWAPVEDARAFLQYRQAGELSTAEWLGGLAHPLTLAVGSVDDPLPGLVAASGVAARAARQAAARIPRGRADRATRGRTNAITRALRAAAARGGAARSAAVRLETLRSVGTRAAATRAGQEATFRRIDVTFYDDYRKTLWESAAETLGASVDRLDGNSLTIARNGRSTTVAGRLVALNDPAAAKLADDKRAIHELLASAGMPVPEQLAFDASDPSPTYAFLERFRPCVVKPLTNSGGGSGMTGEVRTEDDLLRAALKAWRWSDRLVVERQVHGLVYRLLFLDGELLDAIERRPPKLTGDGRSSVSALIKHENAVRLVDRDLVGSLLRVDLDAVLTLRSQGLALHSVPPAGRVFGVKSATSQNARRDNRTYTRDLSPDLIEEARRAVELGGLRLAGVDLVTTDPTRSLVATGGAIIEINAQPGLQHHYEVVDRGGAVDVAVPILDRLLTT